MVTVAVLVLEVIFLEVFCPLKVYIINNKNLNTHGRSVLRDLNIMRVFFFFFFQNLTIVLYFCQEWQSNIGKKLGQIRSYEAFMDMLVNCICADYVCVPENWVPCTTNILEHFKYDYLGIPFHYTLLTCKHVSAIKCNKNAFL